jgi:hypothetical protein
MQKKITDLQLRSNVNDDVNLPADDGIQTYRVTAPQVAAYALAKPRPFVAKTANYTLAAGDHVITADATGGAFALTLPTADGIDGKIYKIKRIDSDPTVDLTITPDGVETIEGDADFKVLPGESVTIISDGTNWVILDQQKILGSIIFREEKTAGTHAGNPTIGSWATRILNTTVNPLSVPWAQLASNQVTLNPGTYLIKGVSPFVARAAHDITNRIRLYNTTDSAMALLGPSEYTNGVSGEDSNWMFSVEGILKLTDTKVFELQYWAVYDSGGGGGYGLGLCSTAADTEIEIYGRLQITKIA